MKRIIILIMIFGAGLIFTKNISAESLQYHGGVYFYSELAPYGSWIQLNDGVMVWRPRYMRPDWAPYRNGYWDWTTDGWYWRSNEPFGYITFHYGRWYYDDYYGWVWYPDNEWAPAWVEWRYDDDYIGWAPLPPYASFSINIGIHFTIGFHTPYYRWHFINYRYMCDPYSYRYYIPRNHVYRFFNRTKYRTNYGYSGGRVINRGISIDFVRNRSGRNIRERTIERVNDPRNIRNEGGRRTDRVRTYYLEREKISRQQVNDRNIIRSNRRSNLDVSKIGVGVRERNMPERRNNEIRKRERKDIRSNPEIRRNDRNNNKRNENYRGRNNNQDNRQRIFKKESNNSRDRNRTYSRPQTRTSKPEIKRNSSHNSRSRESHSNNNRRDHGRGR